MFLLKETLVSFPGREAMAVYDCFAATAGELLGKTEDFFIRLQDQELLILAENGEQPELPALPLPVHSSCEDGQLILRFDLGGEVL